MRIRNKIVAVILIIVYTLNNYLLVKASSDVFYEIPLTVLNKMKLEYSANKKYSEILEYWRLNCKKSVDDSVGYRVNGIMSESFPHYYCGAYINNYSKLTVLINEDDYENGYWMQDLSKICDIKDVSFKKATYSYSELINAIETIGCDNSLLERLSKGDICISSIDIDDQNNRLVINCDKRSYDYIIELCNQKNIRIPISYHIDYTQENEDLITNVFAGQGLQLMGYCTFSGAFRVRKYNSGAYTYGLMTCGHVYSSGNTSVYTYEDNGLHSYVGSIGLHQYSGNTDAAIILAAVNGTGSNTSVSSNIYGTSYYHLAGHITPAQNATVIKRGYATGITSGTVLSSSCYSYGGIDSGFVTLSDMIKASNSAASGDSGGILFSVNGGSVYPSGIVSRKDEYNNSYYTKASNALNSFQGYYVY